jgi:hypothetical protein
MVATGVQRLTQDNKSQLLAVFDVLEEWFTDPAFRGCVAINLTGELAEPTHPARLAATHHKQLFRSYLDQICISEGLPVTIAGHIALIVEGAIVGASVLNQTDSAARGKLIASKLIQKVGI